MQRVLTILLLSWTSLTLSRIFAQGDIDENRPPFYINTIQHVSAESGLISDNVYHLMEDQLGRIWMATDRGVTVYNGIDFKSYTRLDGLGDNEVLSTFQDAQGTVWLASFNGTITKYQNHIFQAFQSKELVSKLGPIRFIKENKGKLIIAPIRGRPVSVEKKNLTSVRYIGEENYSLLYFDEHANVRVSRSDDEEGVYSLDFGSKQSQSANNYVEVNHVHGDTLILTKADDQSNIYTEFWNIQTGRQGHSKMLEELQGEIPLSCSVSGGSLFVGTRNGLFIYSYPELMFQGVDFKGLSVSSILHTSHGNTWVSTLEKGVFEFSTSRIQLKQSAEPAQRIVTSKGKLFFCGAGIVYEYGIDEPIAQIPNTRERITDVEVLGDGSLLLSSGVGLFRVNGKSVQKFNVGGGLKDMIRVDDELKIGAYNGLINIPLTESLRPKITSQRIIEERSNHVIYWNQEYLITNEKGVFHWNGKNSTLTPKYVIEERITDYSQSGSTLVLATTSSGIYVVEKGRLKRFLQGHTVHAVCLKNSEVWAVLDKKIARIRKGKVLYFDPLQLNVYGKINDIQYWKGSILIATSGGVFEINSVDIEQGRNIKPPKILCLDARNLSENEPFRNNLIYDHEVNDFQFQFDAVYFGKGESVRYEYVLKNKKTGRSNRAVSSTGRIAFYDLSPGEYELQVCAVAGSDRSSVETFYFQVDAPFYVKGWFVGVVILLSLLLFAFIWIRRNAKYRKEQQWIALTHEYEQQALRAKMNPHFLFNVLNSIQQFYLKNDNLQGHKYLSKFAHLVRIVLNTTERSEVLLSEEIEYLEKYVELEQLRSNVPFEFRIEMEPTLAANRVLIPTMVLQPAIENSIWHAFPEELLGGMKAIVSLQVAIIDNFIEIKLNDNGCGFDTSSVDLSETENGIGIVANRLEVIGQKYKTKTNFQLKSEIGKGTQITITIPLKYA